MDGIFEERDARQGSVRPKAEPIDAVAILYDIQVSAAEPVGAPTYATLSDKVRTLEEQHSADSSAVATAVGTVVCAGFGSCPGIKYNGLL